MIRPTRPRGPAVAGRPPRPGRQHGQQCPAAGGHLARPEAGRHAGGALPGQRALVAPSPGHPAEESALPGTARVDAPAGAGAVTSRTVSQWGDEVAAWCPPTPDPAPADAG